MKYTTLSVSPEVAERFRRLVARKRSERLARVTVDHALTELMDAGESLVPHVCEGLRRPTGIGPVEACPALGCGGWWSARPGEITPEVPDGMHWTAIPAWRVAAGD